MGGVSVVWGGGKRLVDVVISSSHHNQIQSLNTRTIIPPFPIYQSAS